MINIIILDIYIINESKQYFKLCNNYITAFINYKKGRQNVYNLLKVTIIINKKLYI